MKEITRYIVLIALILFNSVASAQSNANELAQNSNEIIDSIYSKSLHSYQQFWVKYPDNYNPKSKIKYPVVYLLDGFSLKSNLEIVYDNYWGHYMPHMILVGISNRTNRTRDLTISKVESNRGAPMQTDSGGAETFVAFIEEELIPHINKMHRTTNYRTLIGHSYAGLFTIHTLIHHPHLFTNYIAIDPSIEWDNQKLLKEAKSKLKSNSFDGKGLFVALAAEQLHMQNASVTMDNIMEDTSEYSLFARSIVEFSQFANSQKQNKLNFSWKVYPEDLHGTVPLPAMRDGLIELFKWYQFKAPQTYNNPESSVELLQTLLDNQEKIYAKNFGYKVPPMIEELFNGYGYMNLQMGQPEKAYLFFNKAISYYPESANAYDAMADYYIDQKDKIKAIEFVEKAFAISGNSYYKEKLDALKK
ncbi:alpha/beta hydrolase-fold protein [uncultured Psychroserpens sp.]|uniref:alpha/beta hydrolase-fold protein n=1 Tax=uncultured Psychroserpens sp. TaxID=255436 RepID=UPI0026261B6B|nr:alpha/beta hydrolase-fold protein [uncultured Psychroserpens sp.]